jgi:hypothetical protein
MYSKIAAVDHGWTCIYKPAFVSHFHSNSNVYSKGEIQSLEIIRTGYKQKKLKMKHVKVTFNVRQYIANVSI